MNQPKISIVGNILPRLGNNYKSGRMYRIEGGELKPGWESSEGSAPWCEFIIYEGDDHVSSYCGEVWPEAWHAYFVVNSAGTSYPTKKCWNLISKATSDTN